MKYVNNYRPDQKITLLREQSDFIFKAVSSAGFLPGAGIRSVCFYT